MSQVFLKVSQKKPAGAIFLSGSGTNAEKILTHVRENADPPWIPKALVTDRPKTSRAREIARTFGLPLIEHGLVAFYRAHGQDRVTVATSEGRRLREQWTAELLAKLRPFGVDFGILAGFAALTNIAASMPCLNVHPGDLTYEKNGRRYLTGLHTIPVELAILEGLDHLRTSVILVRPFSGRADEVDSGHILGISEKVPLDLQGHTVEELRTIFRNRTHGHVHGANRDLLFDLATRNQEHLKFAADHTVYPAVIDDFARNRFAESEDGVLLYRGQPVRTVEYLRGGVRVPVPL